MFYGTQKLFCPVHPEDEGFLGNRNKNIPTTVKCEECRFYYFFPAGKTIPTKATPARVIENVCTCGGCQDRDAKKRHVG